MPGSKAADCEPGRHWGNYVNATKPFLGSSKWRLRRASDEPRQPRLDCISNDVYKGLSRTGPSRHERGGSMWKAVRCLGLLFLLVLMLTIWVVRTEALPIISLEPAAASVTEGSTFSLSIEIGAALDLFAFQFDLTFDPTRLLAIGITEGPFLGSAGTTLFVPGSVDNVGGAVTATAGTLVGAVSGATGDGSLAVATFTAVTPGTAMLELSNILLLDSRLSPIDFSAVGATITVTGVMSTVPEPPTFMLLGGPLLALALLSTVKTRILHLLRARKIALALR
jgi:hypothetical protein